MNGCRSKLAGKRFGKLLVLCPTDNGPRGTRWVCTCDCGKEYITYTRSLIAEGKTSCGCVRRKGAAGKYKDHSTYRGVGPILLKSRLGFVKRKGYFFRRNHWYKVTDQNSRMTTFKNVSTDVTDEWRTDERAKSLMIYTTQDQLVTAGSAKIRPRYNPSPKQIAAVCKIIQKEKQNKRDEENLQAYNPTDKRYYSLRRAKIYSDHRSKTRGKSNINPF